MSANVVFASDEGAKQSRDLRAKSEISGIASSSSLSAKDRIPRNDRYKKTAGIGM